MEYVWPIAARRHGYGLDKVGSNRSREWHISRKCEKGENLSRSRQLAEALHEPRAKRKDIDKEKTRRHPENIYTRSGRDIKSEMHGACGHALELSC